MRDTFLYHIFTGESLYTFVFIFVRIFIAKGKSLHAFVFIFDQVFIANYFSRKKEQKIDLSSITCQLFFLYFFIIL